MTPTPTASPTTIHPGSSPPASALPSPRTPPSRAPQVMGFVINVGEVVNARMKTRPLMTCPLSLQTGLLLSFGVMMRVRSAAGGAPRRA